MHRTPIASLISGQIFNAPMPGLPPAMQRIYDETNARLESRFPNGFPQASAAATRADPDDEETGPRAIARLEALVATIRSDAERAGRDLTDREERRVEEAQDAIAMLLGDEAIATADRAPPPGRKTSREPMREAGVPRGQQATNARAGILLTPSMQSPHAALFGTRASGWKTSDEFFAAIVHGRNDPRLYSNSTGVEGTGVDGGFDVPNEFYRGVIDQAFQKAVFAPRCRLFPAASNTLTIPLPDLRNRSTSTAGLNSSWVAENSELSPQSMKWIAKELKLNKLALLAEASNELVEDGINYTAQLQGAMSDDAALKLDLAIVTGTGVGMPLGILNSASALQVAKESAQSADTVVYRNLTKLYSALSPDCQKRAVWYVSPNVMPQMLEMVFPGSTNPVLLAGGFNTAATDAPAMTIFGRPVVPTEVASMLGDAGDIIFADMSQYALLLKSGPRIVYDQGPGFTRDVATWRLTQRATGQPLWGTAYTPFNGDTALTWAAYLAPR